MNSVLNDEGENRRVFLAVNKCSCFSSPNEREEEFMDLENI
jgi:hypothetical protein